MDAIPCLSLTHRSQKEEPHDRQQPLVSFPNPAPRGEVDSPREPAAWCLFGFTIRTEILLI